MAGNPSLNASNYLLNIVELQNTVTSASGLTPVGILSNTVAAIQQMVNTSNNSLAVNSISAFSGSNITVTSPFFMSNAGIFYNGAQVIPTASTTSTVTGSGSTTVAYADSTMTFSVGGATALTLAPAAATFAGSVSATNFVTLSDMRWKMGVVELSEPEVDKVLQGTRGVRFHWSDSGASDIGLIAQEIQAVMPEAVLEGPDGLRVSYMKLVPVLVEAVKSLRGRVEALEAAAAAAAAAASRRL